MKKLIIIVIVAAAVAGAGWLFWPRARNVETSALQLHGNVDIREVSLGFRVSGRLKEVLRDEGDEVKTGETLARLDDEPYRHEVDEACAQVDSLQARVSLLQAGNRPQEIAQAEAQVHEREVSAANTERVYKRQQELYQHKTVSLQERDDAEAAYREATARLNSAREQFNLLKAGFRSEDIIQAKAELARAEAMLAGARLKVADSVLQAPADGVVLTRAQEPGAILSAGATVLTVSLRTLRSRLCQGSLRR
jgi:HlyD family secretion protein